jgi:hypothetical protein
VKIAVDNKSGALKVGMPVEAEIPLPADPGVELRDFTVATARWKRCGS